MNQFKRIAFLSEHASPVALLGGTDAGGIERVTGGGEGFRGGVRDGGGIKREGSAGWYAERGERGTAGNERTTIHGLILRLMGIDLSNIHEVGAAGSFVEALRGARDLAQDGGVEGGAISSRYRAGLQPLVVVG